MMRLTFDVARFLGTWRWLAARDTIILSSGISLALGIEPGHGHAGIKAARFAERIHPEDRHVFFDSIEKARCFGGEIDVDYRLTLDGFVEHVKIVGSCIRSRRDGSPAEYIGAIHVREMGPQPALATVAEHLISAAEIARAEAEQMLSYFIDMALMETGSRLAHTKIQRGEKAPEPPV